MDTSGAERAAVDQGSTLLLGCKQSHPILCLSTQSRGG